VCKDEILTLISNTAMEMSRTIIYNPSGVFHCVYVCVLTYCTATVSHSAVWGHSDDSDSEIEAALRPQPFTANHRDDDSDDFFD